MAFSPRRILRNQIIVPFGRFRQKRARPRDDTPVLVGREGQRAFFVDALTGIGERGAFLISGRRGVGKTTFVENCLDDYRQNVFRRFLGSGAGRSVYDFALLMGFVLAMIGVLLASGELLAYLVPQLLHSPLLFIPLLVCVALASIPLVLGLRTVRAALSSIRETGVSLGLLAFFVLFCATLLIPPFGSPTVALAILIVALSFLFFFGSVFFYRRAPLPLGLIDERGNFEAPKLLQLRLLGWDPLAPLALSVLGTTCAAYVAGLFSGSPDIEQLYRFVGFGIILLFGTAMGHAWASKVIIASKSNPIENEAMVGLRLIKQTLSPILLISTVVLIIGLLSGILNQWDVIYGAGVFFTSLLLVSGTRVRAYLGAEWNACLERTNARQELGAAFLWLGAIFLDTYWNVRTSLRSASKDHENTPSKRLGRKEQKNSNPEENRPKDGPRFLVPPVHALLLMKGFALMLISAHLLYPLLFEVLAAATQSTSWRFISASESSALFPVACVGDGAIFQLLCADPSSPLPEKRLGLFDNSSEVFWAVAVFIFVIAMGLLEYEWINRPFVEQRQPRALDRGPRKPQHAHHNLDPIWFEVSASRQFEDWQSDPKHKGNRKSERLMDRYEPSAEAHRPPKADSLFNRRNELQRRVLRRFRTMEAATFTYTVARLWLPVIEVNVNLGFDSLDHRGVTHAMLDGLRRSYRRTFVGLQSPYAILRILGRTFFVMLLIVPLAKMWFDYSDVNASKLHSARDWYDVTQSDRTLACGYLDVSESKYLSNPTSSLKRPLIPTLVCLAGDGVANPILKLLYTEIVPFNVDIDGNEGRVVFWFTHLNQAPPVRIDNAVFQPQPSLSIRVYHLLLATILLVLLTRLARRLPLMPYHKNLARIETLIDELTLSRADTKNTRNGVSFGGLFGVGGDRELSAGVETSREALDPRSVELKLLALLNDLRNKSLGRAYGPWRRFTMPMPDIQFVFDELDKLSGVVGPEFSAHEVAKQDQQALDSERHRAYQLHRLLSDMKRVISSAPARFIFVGGRALHDEWIRDQNRLGSTQPLLTSIFDHEIYLPSLLIDFSRARYDNALVDSGDQPTGSLDLRIREFLICTYLSSKTFEETLIDSRHLPWIGLPRMGSTAMLYSDHVARQRERFADFELIDARMGNAMRKETKGRKTFDAPWNELEALERLQVIWREEFFSIFVGFLAYRSAGSPKKLNELFSELVRPSGALLDPQIERDALVPTSLDSIVIDEKLLYRIQFINSLFRHIEASFGVDLLQRDDKISINTIFMFDFLMKMHNRAFSWSSIERLDELAHIHRAPDLRRLFDAVLTNSAERYFHRVLNGLFAFRFRSELAIEIRYLSRISQAEMAALNFTLDESHELKTKFTSMLESSGDTNDDLMIALGELYEFDQAYDIARDYYERALRSMDREFERLNGPLLSSDDKIQDAAEALVDQFFRPGSRRVLGQSPASDVMRSERPLRPPAPFMHGVLAQSEAAKDAIRLNLPWAIRRLRIMLQIGLTYEQQADEERAQAQYHSACLFGSMILKTALDKHDSDPAPLSHVAKHLPLIFQPVFASAWVAEKLENGVDTSLSIVEREMRALRRSLPFVREVSATETAEMKGLREGGSNRARDARSNHLLVMAELHNKAGDLHFFKGRSSYDVSDKDFPKLLINTPDKRASGQEGYLLRAHYHYAMALHEVRRFVFYRAQMSARRLSINMSDAGVETAELGDWKTLDEKKLPTFVMQTAYSSMVDLAEVVLGRSSMMEAWLELEDTNAETGAGFSQGFDIKSAVDKTQTKYSAQAYSKKLFNAARKEVDAWFHRSDQETRPNKNPCAARTPEHAVQDFFGAWADDGATVDNRLVFGNISPNHERIITALLISLYGSRAINRANYPDAASFESQITAEHVIRLLRGARSILAITNRKEADPAKNNNNRLSSCRDHYKLTRKQLDFLSVLIEIGTLAINRLISLKELAYPDTIKESKGEDNAGEYREDFRTTDTSEIVAAALASELRLLIADLSIQAQESMDKASAENELLDDYLSHWASNMQCVRADTEKLLSKGLMDSVEAYQQNFGKSADKDQEAGTDEGTPLHEQMHRSHARATLIYLVTHHKYPALTNLTALKALIDDALVIDGLCAEKHDEAKARLNEAELWLDELMKGEKLVDAPMHFPPAFLADTLSLHALVRPDNGQVANQARKYRWRAEQSFTMGRQYYQNISRLIYLFDDFNDRRRHSVHAGQMGTADILALYRYVLDDREVWSSFSE